MKKTDSFFSCQCTLSLRARQIFSNFSTLRQTSAKTRDCLAVEFAGPFQKSTRTPRFRLTHKGSYPERDAGLSKGSALQTIYSGSAPALRGWAPSLRRPPTTLIFLTVRALSTTRLFFLKFYTSSFSSRLLDWTATRAFSAREVFMTPHYF